MIALQRFQLIAIKRLLPKSDPIDAMGRKNPGLFDVKRIRIGLNGEFGKRAWEIKVRLNQLRSVPG